MEQYSKGIVKWSSAIFFHCRHIQVYTVWNTIRIIITTMTLLNVYLYHGTIIRTGITCNKISCYMHDSACTWLIVENGMLKYFKVMLNIFEFSHVKEIVESWLVYAKKFSWIIQSCFLTETIKQGQCQFLFLS